MTIDELSRKLDKVTDDFASEINSLYPDGSKTPATEEDLKGLGTQVFYAMRDFKEEIIKYLKDPE